jgi:hypothetical protein
MTYSIENAFEFHLWEVVAVLLHEVAQVIDVDESPISLVDQVVQIVGIKVMSLLHFVQQAYCIQWVVQFGWKQGEKWAVGRCVQRWVTHTRIQSAPQLDVSLGEQEIFEVWEIDAPLAVLVDAAFEQLGFINGDGLVVALEVFGEFNCGQVGVAAFV